LTEQQTYPPQTYPTRYAQPVMVVTPPTSGTAVASLVCGILGFLVGWCLLGVPSIIAVLCGHVALNETRDNRKSGKGMAIAGLILGYLLVVPTIAVFFMFVVGGLTAAAQHH
jgi:Domain of unknown function (DUF4190)